jgi:four helix bundle protein
MMTHKDLNAWKDSVELSLAIYRITKKFPKDEFFSLTNQLRRAAVSVPSNISEGAARNHPKEFIRFIRYSLGSLAEIETQLIIAGRLNYLDQDKLQELTNDTVKIRSQLTGLIRHLEKKSL